MSKKISLKVILFFLIITGILRADGLDKEPPWKDGFYVKKINKRLTIKIQKEAYEVFGYKGGSREL